MIPTDRFLQSSSDSLPQYVYRTFPIQRLLAVIRDTTNHLISPSLWPDPYEAAHLKVEIEHPLYGVKIGDLYYTRPKGPDTYIIGSMRHSTNAAQNVYCQCWSSNPESDAMWRIYSADLGGVKVRAKPEALFQSLQAANPDEECFFGQVDYLPQAELDRELANIKANYLLQMRPDIHKTGPFGELIARSLLKKRLQFAHEQEYRLMVVRAGARRLQSPPSVLPYPVDPDTLFEEVETDPRCPNHAEFEQQLRQAGYRGKVVQSPLYRPPVLRGPTS